MKLTKAVLLKAYPFNLLVDVNGAVSAPDTPKIDLTHLPHDIHLSVEYTLHGLTYEGERAIHLRYRDELTLNEVSEEMCMRPDHARQLICEALNKLAQPCNIRYLRDGLHVCTEQDIETVAAEQVRKARIKDVESFLDLFESFRTMLQQDDSSIDVLPILLAAAGESVRNNQAGATHRADSAPLDSLDRAQEIQCRSLASLGLTARAYNCLTHAGIHTIEDLLIHQPSELMRIRGFGKRSYQCIVEHLAAIGVDTSMY